MATPLRTRPSYGSQTGNGYQQGGVAISRQESFATLWRVWQRLALHLMDSQEMVTPWALGITSAVSGEGKTTTTAGLAVALARESNQETIIVDAGSGVSRLLAGFPTARGPFVEDYLLGKYYLDDVLKPSSLPNLKVLTTSMSGLEDGEEQWDSYTSLLRRHLPEMVKMLKQRATYVFLDLPAMLEDVNTEQMTQKLDGTLMVVRAQVTPMDRAREAFDLMDDSRLLGVVYQGSSSAIPPWLSGLLLE